MPTGWVSEEYETITCSIRSTRRYGAPISLARRSLMVHLPDPGRPPTTTRTGTTAPMVRPSSLPKAFASAESGDHGEPARPADLLGGGQLDLQEAERLQLAGAAQRAGVDGPQATGGDDPGQQRLGVGVVAGDQHGG